MIAHDYSTLNATEAIDETWGGTGGMGGCFSSPTAAHAVECGGRELVAVADCENDRVQLLRGDGSGTQPAQISPIPPQTATVTLSSVLRHPTTTASTSH